MQVLRALQSDLFFLASAREAKELVKAHNRRLDLVCSSSACRQRLLGMDKRKSGEDSRAWRCLSLG